MRRTGLLEHLGDRSGMTLAEVLIVVGIVGVGLAALSAAIPLAAYGVQEGNQLSTATFLANQRLEQVKTARWEQGPPPVDALGVSADGTAAPRSADLMSFPDERPMAAPYSAYSREVRIADCGAAIDCGGVANADLRQVSVTVSYRPMTGVGMAPAASAKLVTLTTYVARR